MWIKCILRAFRCLSNNMLLCFDRIESGEVDSGRWNATPSPQCRTAEGEKWNQSPGMWLERFEWKKNYPVIPNEWRMCGSLCLDKFPFEQQIQSNIQNCLYRQWTGSEYILDISLITTMRAFCSLCQDKRWFHFIIALYCLTIANSGITIVCIPNNGAKISVKYSAVAAGTVAF